jgi:hypothetical protein
MGWESCINMIAMGAMNNTACRCSECGVVVQRIAGDSGAKTGERCRVERRTENDEVTSDECEEVKGTTTDEH